MRKSKLTIFATTFNEAEHLEFWYDHHKDLADEFVIVDTDSTDGTQEIAKKLPIKFVEIKWHHSFAGAKNIALRHCTGDWVLSLSPDFWIDKENFQLIKDTIKHGKSIAYWLPLFHHFTDWNGGSEEKPKTVKVPKTDYLTNAHMALFKNDPQIHYRGRVHENIHECVYEAYGKDKCGFLPVVRHHDNTKNQINNIKKIKYYWFLEHMSAIERKVWEEGQILRKEAYDAEL